MKNDFLKGMRCAVPVILGYFPIGMAFGVLAVQQGLELPEIALMSLIVYAGSAQFIASAMISSSAAGAAVVATTFLVNLRHLLMSASMSPYLKKASTPLQAVIALGITDETFSVGITKASQGESSPHFFMGLHSIAHLSWIISTIIGGLAGSAVPEPGKWGLDFALPAMFIGLLVMQLKSRKELLVALFSGLLSLGIAVGFKGNYNIIIASVLAATLGVFIET